MAGAFIAAVTAAETAAADTAAKLETMLSLCLVLMLKMAEVSWPSVGGSVGGAGRSTGWVFSCGGFANLTSDVKSKRVRG